MALLHNETSAEARRLFRCFILNLESQMSPNPPSNQFARVVVKARDRVDLRELAEWRKYFEPWSVSEWEPETTFQYVGLLILTSPIAETLTW